MDVPLAWTTLLLITNRAEIQSKGLMVSSFMNSLGERVLESLDILRDKHRVQTCITEVQFQLANTDCGVNHRWSGNGTIFSKWDSSLEVQAPPAAISFPGPSLSCSNTGLLWIYGLSKHFPHLNHAWAKPSPNWAELHLNGSFPEYMCIFPACISGYISLQAHKLHTYP